MTKKIGIVTGGGDCPGLNAVIRAVAKAATMRGWEPIGILGGYEGLLEPQQFRPLDYKALDGLLTRGGTILGTANRGKFSAKVGHGEGRQLPKELLDATKAGMEKLGISALVSIGGDGSLSIALQMQEHGIPIIGVPKTIDNDIVGTEITFGFLTAVATATDALDKLHSTADSHHRVMVCEVMGRNAGWIALTSGVASGSDLILVPEIPFELSHICDNIRHRMSKGPGFAIVVAAEGARPKGGEQVVDRMDHTSPDPIRLGGVGRWVADEIARHTGIETRSSALGHIQRGGGPIAADRILATHFGYHAIRTLMEGKRGRMVVRQGNMFGDVDLLHAAGKQRLVPSNHPLIEAARAIGTGFGDGRTPEPASQEPSVVV